MIKYRTFFDFYSMNAIGERMVKGIAGFSSLCVLVTGFSCTNKPKDNAAQNETEQIQDTVPKIATDTIKALDLTDVPFKLPEDWVNVRLPSPEVKNLTSISADPIKPRVTVAIWDYQALNFQDLMDSLTVDLKSIGSELTYTLKENDTIDAVTIYPDGTKFNWIGAFYEKGELMRLITVGAFEQYYASETETIQEIYSSIQVGK